MIFYCMNAKGVMLNRHLKRYRISSLRRGQLWGLLVALLLAAFAVRALSLDAQGLWRDEVDALNFATVPWDELLQKFTLHGWNGPLYSLLLRGWIALTGRTAFAMRYFSLLCGLAAIALFYVLGRRLVGREATLGALPLAAFSPYLVWYAQEVKMYTWVPSLVLLALYALERSCERPRWWWWAAVLIATSLAMYSHILAALLIPVEVLWFLLHPRRHRQAWSGGLTVLALLTLPYLPLLRWQAPMIFEVRETGFLAYTLWEMVQVLLVGWSVGVTSWGARVGAIWLGGVAVLGITGLCWRRAWRRAGQFLLWVSLPLLAIWAVSLRGPIFTDRYLIWTAPAVYLAVGAGLAFVGRWRRDVAAALLAGLLMLAGVNLYRQATRPFKPQFQEATSYLQQQRASDELLLFQIPYNHIMVEYYADAPVAPWAEAPYTNWRTPEGGYLRDAGDVDGEMHALTQGYAGVWLVYSEVELWDERQLVKAWLDTHGTLVDEQHFHKVALYHYVLD